MSTKFDALCYVRIFSDKGDKLVNKAKWEIIPIKRDEGFNYISRYIYCKVGEIGATIAKLCEEFGPEINNIMDCEDECQIYVWIKRGGRIEKLNAVEITSQSMRFLSSFDASICFSADRGFPNI